MKWRPVYNEDGTIARYAHLFNPDRHAEGDDAVQGVAVVEPDVGMWTAWIDYSDGNPPVKPKRRLRTSDGAKAWCFRQLRDIL